MSDDKIVTIAKFTDPVRAEMALNELEAAGIPGALRGHDTFAEAVPLHGMMELQVAGEHEAQALELLKHWEAGDSPE